MSLSDELRRAREYLSGAKPPPSNEANTCNRVIRPLLQKCGYEHDDIDEQGHDAAGGIPDYMLLPDTSQTWFLEAKAWQIALNDSHATQAVNYANTQGKRWVALSNGREWQLYDNHLVQFPPAGRRVATAKLDCDGQVETLLNALSKDSVTAGRLEAFVRDSRLRAFLTRQMQERDSAVLKAIAKIAAQELALSAPPINEIWSFFQDRAASVPVPPVLAPSDSIPVLPAVAPPSASPEIRSDSLTLRELKQNNTDINGGTPDILIFPDGTKNPVFTWREVAMGVVEWLFVRGKTPNFPYSEQKHGKRFFINTTPHFGVTDRHEHKSIEVQGQTYYIHVNRSRTDFMRCLIALCEEVGESPDGFRVALK